MKAYFSSKRVVIFIIAIFLLLLFIGFIVKGGADTVKSRKPSVDWGRGLLLGENALTKAALMVDNTTNDVHAAWFFWEESKGVGLHYVQIDQEARVQVDRELMQFSGRVRSPNLIAGGQFMHLVWAGYEGDMGKWQLWYAQLNQSGSIQGRAIRLSNSTSNVSQYSVVSDKNGGFLAVWEETESGGINFAHVGASGEKKITPISIVNQGTLPILCKDAQSQIHLVWIEDNENLMYKQLDSQTSMPVEGTMIGRILHGTGSRLEGPSLGLANQHVYVFWSVLNQSGLEAGTATTEYVFFPVGYPKEVSVATAVPVLPLEEQPYEDTQGHYTYSQLVPALYAKRTSDFVYNPIVVDNPSSELAVALAVQQQHRLDSYIQIVITIVNDGKYKGYTFATKTKTISSDAALSADTAGNLYLIWRDGFDGKNIYYTTTAQDARSALDGLILQDMTALVLEGGMEIIVSILLFPFAFLWLLPGLVVLISWQLINNDEDLTNIVSVVLLVLASTLYHGTKLVTFPTMIDYVPLSAWIDIAPSFQLPLRILVPFSIFCLSIGVAEKIRRQSKSTTLRYYFSIVIVDTVFTLAIYGVNFLGAY